MNVVSPHKTWKNSECVWQRESMFLWELLK